MIEQVDVSFLSSMNRSYALPLMDEFIDSGFQAAKVSIEGRTPSALVQSIRKAIIEHHYPAKAIVRDGDVYLIRSDIDNGKDVQVP